MAFTRPRHGSLCAAALLGGSLLSCRAEPARQPAAVIAVGDVGASRSSPIATSDDPRLGDVPRERSQGQLLHLPCSEEGRIRSQASLASLHLQFLNPGPRTLSLFWLDFGGARVHYMDIEPGEVYRQQTYVTHPWIAIAHDGRCLGIVTPTGVEQPEVVTFER